MPISIYPMTPNFAAEVGDLDLSQSLDAETLAEVRQAFVRFAVLIFPAQSLTTEQHIAFGANFGRLETSINVHFHGFKRRLREEIADVANVGPDGKPWAEGDRVRMIQMGNRLWHTDSSFKQPTAYASMLYAHTIAPIGGHTQYADLRAAYAALPADLKTAVQGLIAEHSLMFSRARLGFYDFTDHEREVFAPVARPLVRRLPDSGRDTLYIASHIGRIRDKTEAETKALFDALVAHATQPEFVYTNRWRTGDLVMWDNRCTMHRGTDFDDLRYVRDMRRVTTEDAPDAFAAAVSSMAPAASVG